MDQGTSSAFIAIVGKPNVGKSSLLNALVGEKVAIVSGRPQTTRTRITGVLTKGLAQFVFIDTPGLHKPKNKLSEHMVKTINDSVADVDAVVLVVEAQGKPTKAELELVENIKSQRLPAILLINKTDLVDKATVAEKIAAMAGLYDFTAVVPASVLEGQGVDTLLTELMALAQPGPHFFPDDTLTDQPERVIVAEIIREKMLNLLREEVPHGIAVAVESMKEREDRELMDIEATIFCEKKSHKGIVIGKGGSMLRNIGTQAREEIEGFLGVKVNLQCWVKIKDDWRNKEGIIKTLGLS